MNGRVVAREAAGPGGGPGAGDDHRGPTGAWIAARSVSDHEIHSAFATAMAAHTSPVYLEVTDRPILFDATTRGHRRGDRRDRALARDDGGDRRPGPRATHGRPVRPRPRRSATRRLRRARGRTHRDEDRPRPVHAPGSAVRRGLRDRRRHRLRLDRAFAPARLHPVLHPPAGGPSEGRRVPVGPPGTGIELASILPLYRWSGPDEDERQAAVRYWKRAIQLAVERRLYDDELGVQRPPRSGVPGARPSSGGRWRSCCRSSSARASG